MAKKIFSLFLIGIMLLNFYGVYAYNESDVFLCNKIIELEDTSLANGMYKGQSLSASAGKYVKSFSGTYISTVNDIKKDDLSFIVNMENEGTYYAFLRVCFNSVSDISFFYRWDESPWQLFTGTYSDDYQWVKFNENYLEKGLHKLQISHRSTGVYFDAAYITENAEVIPEKPENVVSVEKEKTGYIISQKKECVVSGDGTVFEVEDCYVKQGMTILGFPDASGGKAVRCSIRGSTSLPASGKEGVIEFTFTAEERGKYTVWVRGLFETTGTRRWHTGVNNEGYVDVNYPIVEGWSWTTIVSDRFMEAGEKATVKINPVHMNWTMDQFVVTKESMYMPEGIVNEVSMEEIPLLTPNTPLPPYNPVKGEHPRIFFTKDKIESIKTNINHPENAYAKSVFEANVNENLKLPSEHDESVLIKIESKALAYALYGNEKAGRDAIDLTMEVGETWHSSLSLVSYRVSGRQIYSAAMVYDWCYPLLTDEEKDTIIKNCIGWQSMSEIGWPPDKQLSMSGHGAEDQLLLNAMSFAIAVYDERPDIWDFVGGRFYTYYIPERLFLHQGGIRHEGTNYGIVRHLYDLYSYFLITGMGAPAPYNPEHLGVMAYGRQIYTRRPDGMVALSGDGYNATPMTYALSYTYTTFMEYCMSKDPYIKDEFIRSAVSGTKDGLVTSFGVGVNVYLILNDVNVDRKSIKNLPLSKYFGTPNGVMVARTGWDDGVESDDVVATIHFNEYYTAAHQHLDAGNFELYYKGPLASDSGVYKIFGTEEHSIYTRQTVAHNCILVYDPDENLDNFRFSQYVTNTGGQRNPYGSGGEFSFETMMSNPEYRRATVTAQEIDPKNPIEPEYTYIKGDLGNAYSDKVSDYKRSFMFLNLDDKEVPGALIVFDKMDTSNPEFKKTWLLHGQTYPEFDKTRTIWGSTNYVSPQGEEYKGKMVVDTLLPKNPKMDVVGGEEDGWSNVNGVKYVGLDTMETREENTYRLEVSPSENTKTTYFLNCLQVTDRDNKKYLETELIENNDFYGIKISDRIVMFSKNAEVLNKEISFETKGQGIFKYTVCDLDKGQWEVTLNGVPKIYTVTEEGKVLAFEGTSGKIELKRISETYEEIKTEIKLVDSQRYYVKYTSKLIGFPTEPEIINGKLMVPASGLLTKMEIEQKREFINYKFIDDKQKIEILIQPNTNVMVKNGKITQTLNNSYIKDGELMVELRAFAEAFNFKVYWDEYEEFAAIYPQKIVVSEDSIGYAKIIDVKDDGGKVDPAYVATQVADGLISTNWAAEGIGRYIDFELSEEVILENAEIAFNPGAMRTPSFDIAISPDGVNYETIYSGKGDPTTDGSYFEVFKFDVNKTFKTKYVRYIANGSDKSKWNGVKEIRFKIGEAMEAWETSDDTVKIKSISGDGKENDGENIITNLIDLNSRTYWSAVGKGRFVTFELENPLAVSGVKIVFKDEKDRSQKFDISVSSDGKEFKMVYSGTGKANPSNYEWEEFNFEPCENVKFVRYTGNGSNFNKLNEINEIEIVRGE